MDDDPIVDEVREVRGRLNQEAGYDLDELARKAKECVMRLGLRFCPLKPIVRTFAA